MSILSGPTHKASNPVEREPALLSLCPTCLRVDGCPLVVGEDVPLDVLKLEDVGLKNDGRECVEDVGRCDGLSANSMKLAPSSKWIFDTWKPD